MKVARVLLERVGIFCLVVALLAGVRLSAFAQEAAAPKNSDDATSNPVPVKVPCKPAIADANGVYNVGCGVTPPKLIHSVDPKYSWQARAAKHEGICVIELVVDRKGLPQSIRVVQAAGKGLDENAVKAVKKYQFEPAAYNGQPVPVDIKIEVRFRIW